MHCVFLEVDQIFCCMHSYAVSLVMQYHIVSSTPDNNNNEGLEPEWPDLTKLS